MYNFDAKKERDNLIEWIRIWFSQNGDHCNAIIGISGGKDSTIAAALCVEALGKSRVIGVLMPNGIQKDIDDAKEVCKLLGIKSFTVNIHDSYNAFLMQLDQNGITATSQTKDNLAPRLRMTTLYGIAQSFNGRVINTCNLSENMCGYSTLYGDHAGDVSLFDQLTVTEIREIGHELGLPSYLVDKTPSDGLTGKTDEECYGFSYSTLDCFIRTGVCCDLDVKEKIMERYRNGKFKLDLIHFPCYDPLFPNYVEREDYLSTYYR